MPARIRQLTLHAHHAFTIAALAALPIRQSPVLEHADTRLVIMQLWLLHKLWG
jgi:hypothetical protein